MLLYVARVFTATVVGRTLKTVRCEKCNTEFAYQLARAGAGESHAPYYLGQDSAKRDAAATAQSNLDARLKHEVELVPCPNCHWVNESAIRLFRNSRYRAWSWLIYILLFFVIFIDLLCYFDAQDILGRPPSLYAREILVITGIGSAIILTTLSLRAWARWRINPNRTRAGIQILPPATPPALLIDPVTQAVKIFPNQLRPDADARWAIFRVGQLNLEPFCCMCLTQPDRVYGNSALRRFIGIAHASFPVPLCRRCQWRLRLQSCLGAVSAIAAACIMGWLLARLHGDRDARAIMTFVYGFVAALAFGVFISYWLKPYRIQTLDTLRGVWRIAFRNPAYTALLIRRIGQSEGYFPPDPSSPDPRAPTTNDQQ